MGTFNEAKASLHLTLEKYREEYEREEKEERVKGVGEGEDAGREKELIEIVGRSEGPGKPHLLGTSQRFMEYFGLKSLGDLPKLKDFGQPENEIGEPAPIEEIVELTLLSVDQPIPGFENE